MVINLIKEVSDHDYRSKVFFLRFFCGGLMTHPDEIG